MKKLPLILVSIPLLIALPLSSSARVNGVQSTAPKAVSTAAWKELSVLTFNPSPDPQTCIASGSADVRKPTTGTKNQYVVTLTIDAPSPAANGACERLVEFGNPDDSSKEISTTCTFQGVTAKSHSVRLLIKKVGAAASTIVSDSSMTVSCTDNKL